LTGRAPPLDWTATPRPAFYFHRAANNSLPLDVRWLNGYRLLESHLVGDLTRPVVIPPSGAHSSHGLRPSWFQSRIRVRPRLECSKKRAFAAHAAHDDRSEAVRTRDPRNAMERILRVFERMVIAVINEHPDRSNNPVRFEAQT
jgi:hypothetical protein